MSDLRFGWDRRFGQALVISRLLAGAGRPLRFPLWVRPVPAAMGVVSALLVEGAGEERRALVGALGPDDSWASSVVVPGSLDDLLEGLDG